MKHSNSFWKRTIIGCSLLGMVIVTALPAQAAVQAATLNEHTVSAVSTYTGTNAALATSKTAAINTATSTTNTTTNDATLTASKTTAKKAALNKTSLKLKKGKTYQLNIVRLLQIWLPKQQPSEAAICHSGRIHLGHANQRTISIKNNLPALK